MIEKMTEGLISRMAAEQLVNAGQRKQYEYAVISLAERFLSVLFFYHNNLFFISSWQFILHQKIQDVVRNVFCLSLYHSVYRFCESSKYAYGRHGVNGGQESGKNYGFTGNGRYLLLYDRESRSCSDKLYDDCRHIVRVSS